MRSRIDDGIVEDVPARPPAHPVPLVGRERERELIDRLLDDLATGRGGTLVISGEPGIGKTTLVDELATAARRRGLLALRGHCADVAAAVPYAPLVEVVEQALAEAPAAALRQALAGDGAAVARLVPELREVFPDLRPPADLPGAEQAQYLTAGVVAFLSQLARRRAAAVVLDDIQWADEATLLALERLAGTARVLLACTCRQEGRVPGAAHEHAVEALARAPRSRTLRLGPLPEADVSGMLRALSARPPPAAVAAAIHGHTDGNPFFVEEVFRHLAEEGRLFAAAGEWAPELELGELDVPPGVLAVLDGRLRRLSGDARALLTAAAVAGREFDLEVVRSASELDDDAFRRALEEAEAAALALPAAAGRRAFSHELVRQTLLGTVSTRRRQTLHARVAEAIEALAGGSAGARAAELVHHLTGAGPRADSDRLRSYLLLSGDQALERAAFREARALYERALELAGANPAERAEALERLGSAQRSLGNVEAARSSWAEAFHLFEGDGDADAAARVALALAYQLGWNGRWSESAEVAERALALPGVSNAAVRGGLLGRVAVASSHRNEAAAKRTIEEATRLAEAGDDPRLLGEVLDNAMLCNWNLLDLPALVDTGRRAAREHRAADYAWGLALALALVELGLVYLGRSAESRSVGDELGDLPLRVGHPIASLASLRAKAFRELAESGDLERFELAMARDLELNEAGDSPWAGYSHAYLGCTAFYRGRWEKARRRFDLAAQHEVPGTYAGVQAAVRSLHEAYIGATAETADSLRGMAEQVVAQRAWSHASCARLLAAVEGLAQLGELDAAGGLYPLVTAWIERGMVCAVPTLRLLETLAGIAANAGGGWEAADGHFREALRQAEELPHRIEQAEVRRLWAEGLIRRGEPGDGARIGELLAGAAARYRELGMPRHAELADVALRRAAVGPARTRPANMFRHEGDYWELAFEGRTVRLKDSKGLRYLARLLAEPGCELHAADLALGAAGDPEVAAGGTQAAAADGLRVTRLGPAGEILDEEARAAYRSRIAVLDEELVEATRHNDPERAARAREELDFLTAELAGALGLGGRPRLAGDPVERARKAVSNRIRASIARIGEEHPALARHLEAAVRTGRVCSYRPDRPVRWR